MPNTFVDDGNGYFKEVNEKGEIVGWSKKIDPGDGLRKTISRARPDAGEREVLLHSPGGSDKLRRSGAPAIFQPVTEKDLPTLETVNVRSAIPRRRSRWHISPS